MSEAPDLVRQRQTGQHVLPLPACPVGMDMGTVGSGGAVLTGQVAAVNIDYRDGRYHAAESERFRKARLHVEKAIKEKKIFAVQGPYPVIRRLLRARGWVERKLPHNGKQLKRQPGDQKKQQPEKRTSGDEQGEAVLNPRGGAQPSLGTTEPLHHPWPCDKENREEREDEDKEECSEDSDDIHELMSFLVQDQVPNFLWTIRLSTIDQKLLPRIEVVNRYPRLYALCTKEGLCQSLQNLPWFEQVDFNTFFPRCYRLGIEDEQEAFIEDFRLTAARSLLKLALQKVGDRPVGTEQPPKSDEVPAGPCSPLYPQLLEEALEVCEQHLGILGHQDIDRNTPSPCRTCIDWDRFLQEYYRVAHEGTRLVLSREQRKQCQDLLQRLEKQLPQLGIEGNLNIWILKPSAKSRGRGKHGAHTSCGRGKAGGSTGRTHPHGAGIPPSLRYPGIVCATRLEEVLELAKSCTKPSARVCEWVVQKYVERPLTVFNTKFDIRQWFVVTDWKPLTVWFYRECYLRFCSQPFSLYHLEPARHLCNVSIQKRYKTLQPDPRVPHDKIWSNKQFQAHLAQLGRADAWQRVMVPGMKAGILNALRCARDQVGSRKGSFELFGADFLIGEDFRPWLLEINSCPTMSPSSAVTRRLCANVQRDTLRLVLDRKDNPTCSIGAFELLYKEAAVASCLTVGLKLLVTGCSLKKSQPAKHGSQDKLRTTASSAPQLSAPSGDKASKVPWSREAREKLSPLGPQSSCCLPTSDPPALPQSPSYSAGDQELPWLLHLVVGQPEEAQPQEAQPQEAQPQEASPPITSCPLESGPVSPSQETTRSPSCQSPGSSAGSQELPWLLHLVGQPEDAQPQEAHTQETQPKATSSLIDVRPLDRLPLLQEARRRRWRPRGSSARSQGLPQLSQLGGQPQAAQPHTVLPLINGRRLSTGTPGPCLEQKKHTPAPKRVQKTWDTETSPRGGSALPILDGVTQQHPAASHANHTPLLCRGSHLNLHSCFNRLS
ncbi:PREDICTED: LOW QUALITY PROTEIN: tubulin monoglycylase TTLL3-like [Sturnus vulgaris]|uniref:LOW QUALITY PROTEIN: tubulin monoglycylase TTLL3-like n=1 Tax=Sturnus vulgaris TaxID=9172 RepID=UPI00071A466B|nr:PREDICTED: LOW QUALITY PROTEIN: tubulin monoglycylase TTLL3-like [Sturnus vulgaris]